MMKVIFPRMETMHFHGAYDGGSKLIQQLSEELVKRGIDVEIVTTQLRNNPDLKESVYNGVKHVFIPPMYTGKRLIPFNMFYKLKFSKNLSRYLETQKFDILHNSEAFAYHYLHNKNRKKIIFQSWALEPFYGYEASSQKGLRKLYVNTFLKIPWGYCIRHADVVTADHPSQIPNILKLGVKKEKIEYIPIAIHFKKIQELKHKFKDRRKELGFKKSDVVLLNVGQMVPEKGIDEIIRGFALVKNKMPNAKLIMIGKGILENHMHSMITELGLENDVVHLKNVPEEILFDYFFSSDIFISATHTNYPTISLQKAMATGLAIISASDVFLIENGVNGYVVGLKNPAGIAEGVIKICESGKIKTMGKNAIKKVESSDYETVVNKAIKVYKKLLNKKL